MRVVLFVCLFAACAPRLRAGFEIEGGDFTDSNIYSVVDDNGINTTQVQADDKVKWIYYDFETNKEVTDADPTWDLAFQRFKIRMNGGAGGPGDAGVIILKNTTFDDVTAVPDAAFLQDTPNPKGGEADLVFTRDDAWYYYDLSTHTLTSRKHVYIVRSTEDSYYKLEIINYYDSLGSSGYPAFRWVKLP